LGSRALVLAQAVLTLLAPHQLLRQRARLQRARDTRRAGKAVVSPRPPGSAGSRAADIEGKGR
jgi:hypothetical protein